MSDNIGKKIFDGSTRTLGTALAAGLITWGVTGLSGAPATTSILGVNIPVPVYMGVAVGAASGLYEGYYNFLYPMIPESIRSSETTNWLLTARPLITGVTAGVALPAIMALSGTPVNSTNALVAFGIGFASDLIGGYVKEGLDKIFFSNGNNGSNFQLAVQTPMTLQLVD